MISARQFRTIALAEALSFVGLLIASYFKHVGDSPTAVGILGPIHGALFVVYIVGALVVRSKMNWTTLVTLGVLLGAVVPLGGFVVDRWIARQESGDRTYASTNAR